MVKKTETTNEEFCGTTYAARLLGLSVGTVQQLVESKTLSGWKTDGGHRRISMESIRDYQKSHSGGLNSMPPKAEKYYIVVVEDDINTQMMYQAYFESWSMPFEIVIYSTAIEALLDLPVLQPLLLLTDLRMADMDGFKLIKAIREHEKFSSMLIIAITGLSHDAIQEEGGVDKDILVLKKPIDMGWFKGFLDGIVKIKINS